jgi:hypothetical protein
MRKMQFLLGLVIFLICGGNLTFASVTNELRVTVAPNPWIDASFVKKTKTKQDGWMIYIRFTNKTKKPIYGLSTSFDRFEDNWKIDSRVRLLTQSSMMLKPKESRTLHWMENIPSSITRVHIHWVEPYFENNFAIKPPANR